MSRAALAYAFLIALPAVVLAALAVRVAERDRDAALGAFRERLEEEAADLARRIEGALADAGARAREAMARAVSNEARPGDPPVAFLLESGAVSWSLDGLGEASGPYAGPPEPLDPGELDLYRLSLRGGEAFELARGDPFRALDAYAFYLPRIRSPFLRARLRHRIARAALSAGEERLGEAVLRDLAADRGGRRTEEGLPIAWLAALRLAARGQSLPEETAARLREEARSLSTALLAELARRIAPDDAELARLVASRRRLEERLAKAPDLGGSEKMLLQGDRLVVCMRVAALERAASSLEERPAAAKGARAVCETGVTLPELGRRGRFEAELVSSATAFEEAPDRALRPIRAGFSSPLAVLRVCDTRHDTEVAGVDRRRAVTLALVGLMALVTLAGGGFLLAAGARARRLADLRRQLVANVSHELRTPITSIRMFSEMLAQDPLDERRTRRFGRLLRGESLRLGQLVENLLEGSRGEARDAPLRSGAVDIAATLRALAEGFRYRAERAGVRFELGIEADGIEISDGARDGPRGLVARADTEAVERIVLNLLDNALKYGSSGASAIRLEARERDGTVRVSVRDRGRGIPPAERERVFEELHRLGYEDYAVPGAGLGLAIARRLARRMGGDVELEPSGGPGSVFTLVLPKAMDGDRDGAVDGKAGAERGGAA